MTHRWHKYYAQFVIVLGFTLRGYKQDRVIELLAQSALETGNWGDGTWWDNKNLFGMSEMQNPQRRTRLIGMHLGPDGLWRAHFKNLWKSVADRADWDKQMGIVHNEIYAQQVSSIFHTSEDYATAWLARIDGSLRRSYFVSLAIVPLTLLILIKCLRY